MKNRKCIFTENQWKDLFLAIPFPSTAQILDHEAPLQERQLSTMPLMLPKGTSRTEYERQTPFLKFQFPLVKIIPVYILRYDQPMILEVAVCASWVTAQYGQCLVCVRTQKFFAQTI